MYSYISERFLQACQLHEPVFSFKSVLLSPAGTLREGSDVLRIRNISVPPYYLMRPDFSFSFGQRFPYSLTYYYYIRTGLYPGYIFFFSKRIIRIFLILFFLCTRVLNG